MNGASKILTVSYGTFSCTLEGFDDPFNTMKAIAEYFRDLAADDRYFGAEPPTPDAAMLHKIAEREIQRRVESKIQENGVILRAEDGPLPRVTMPAYGHEPAPVAAVAPTVAPTFAPAAEVTVESAAARLSRLRAAQALAMQPAPAAPMGDISARFADIPAYAEDQDADLPAPMVAAPVVAEQPVIVEQPPAATEPAVIEQPVAAEPEFEPEFEPGAEAAFEPETIADPAFEAEAEIEAQPAFEPEAEAEAEAQPAFEAEAEAVVETAFEPEAEPMAEPQPEADISSILASLAADAPAPVQAEEPAQAEAATTDDVTASLLETLAGLNITDDQLAQDVAETESAPEPKAEAVFDEVEDAVDAQDLNDLALLDAAPEIEPQPEPQPEPAAEPAAELAISPTAPVVAEKLQRARARVIKIRRLDKKPEDATADQGPTFVIEAPTPVDADLVDAAPIAAIAPPAEPVVDTPAEPVLDAQIEAAEPVPAFEAEIEAAVEAAEPSAEILPEVVLSAEAEAALASELAALEAEMAPMATEEAPEPLAEPHVEAKLAAADDAAVDRLLAQTNTQLEVPETKRRRSAIAHLKAAVLATVAERRINPNANKSDAAVKQDPYRQDLNQVVRPATPATPAPERPAMERPAPLVLVSAQRIDKPRDLAADAHRPVPQVVPSLPQPAATAVAVSGPVQPVRPRRVTPTGITPQSSLAHALTEPQDDLTADELDNIFNDGSKQSFADFAESLGASSLAELLEAAGVYSTVVLDRPSFTRPQLFRQVSQMAEINDQTKEETLRNFGKLLREGRIQKSVRGQFTLSDKSPLLTEAKRIAG